MIRTVFDHTGDLWLTVEDHLYHAADAGQSFTKITTAEKIEKVGFGKAAPAGTYPAIFISGSVNGVEGIFRSDNATQSWERIDDDQHRYGALNVVIGDPRVYGRVYVGTTGRGIVYGELLQTSE